MPRVPSKGNSLVVKMFLSTTYLERPIACENMSNSFCSHLRGSDMLTPIKAI